MLMIRSLFTDSTPPPWSASRHFFSLAALFSLAVLSGCQKPDPITIHESVPVTRHLEGKAKSPLVDDTPRFRMIAAINEQQSETWIFKLAGKLDQISAAENAWTTFLASVRFENEKPVWTLPETWRAGDERPMRFATLYTGPGEDAAELAISSLPSGQPLAANVNRWRNQLGLAPLSEQKVLDALIEITGEKTRFLVFDAKGPKYDTGMGGMGAPPFAQGAPAANPSSGQTMEDFHSGVADAMPPKTEEELPLPDSFQFDQPQGWESGKRSSIVFGRWTKAFDGEAAELTLMNIRPTDESWQLNLQAWSSQVGVTEPVRAEEITTGIKIDGTDGKFVRIDGEKPESDGKTVAQSVIIAMFKDHEGEGWVVKLAGKRSAVDLARPEFDKFLESIKLGHRE
jgi:hypothetical protein